MGEETDVDLPDMPEENFIKVVSKSRQFTVYHMCKTWLQKSTQWVGYGGGDFEIKT